MSTDTRSHPVVLLEAHDDSRRIYEDVLRGAGLTVVSVVDCNAAFEASTHRQPCIIVASFDSLTRTECLTLCDRLKSDTRTQTVPIIFASVNIDGADLHSAITASLIALTVPALDGTKLLGAIRGVLAADEQLLARPA